MFKKSKRIIAKLLLGVILVTQLPVNSFVSEAATKFQTPLYIGSKNKDIKTDNTATSLTGLDIFEDTEFDGDVAMLFYGSAINASKVSGFETAFSIKGRLGVVFGIDENGDEGFYSAYSDSDAANFKVGFKVLTNSYKEVLLGDGARKQYSHISIDQCRTAYGMYVTEGNKISEQLIFGEVTINEKCIISALEVAKKPKVVAGLASTLLHIDLTAPGDASLADDSKFPINIGSFNGKPLTLIKDDTTGEVTLHITDTSGADHVIGKVTKDGDATAFLAAAAKYSNDDNDLMTDATFVSNFKAWGTVIAKYKSDISQKTQDEAQDQAADASNKKAGTTYEKYAYLLGQYPIKGDTAFQQYTGTYTLDTFPKKDSSVSEDEDLTESQIEALRMYWYIHSKLSNMSFTKPATSTNTELRLKDSSYSSIDNSEAKNEYSLEQMVQFVKDIQPRYYESTSGSTSYDFSMMYADDIAKYYAAIAMGCTPGADSSAVNYIPELSYLKSIMPHKEDTLPESVVLRTANVLGFKEMSKLGTVAGTEEAYNALFDLYYLQAMMITFSEEGDRVQKLEEFVKTFGSDPDTVMEKENGKAEFKKVSKDIKSVIAVCKAVEFLGIDVSDDWCKSLNELKDLYNKLLPFEDLVIEVTYESLDTEGEPMHTFFSIKNSRLSDDYLRGVIMSSTFKPLTTNLYEITSISRTTDTEWVTRFHYPFGFYRKALFIDTDDNCAINTYITKKNKGSTRVATLRDMLEPDKDIMLYLDTNFYNIDKLASLRGVTYNKLQNTETAGSDTSNNTVIENITNWWDTVNSIDIEAIVKSGGNSDYSRNVKKKASEYGEEKSRGDEYILNDEKIDEYLTGYAEQEEDEYYDEYTPFQSFAVVSAIYRDSDLYSKVRALNRHAPAVFVSSPNLAATTGISEKEFGSLYNYTMLKNLESSLGIDYKSTLDIDEPLYMDIYGNILTESGLVVIPAASNATLCEAAEYTPATVGFLHLYEQEDYRIPVSYNNTDTMLPSIFVQDERTYTYKLGQKLLNNVVINFDKFPVSDESVLSQLELIMEDKVKNDSYLLFDKHVYIITEVMRGAPLENIDKDFEGLHGNRSVNKLGIWSAMKLDEITENMLKGISENAILSLPNLGYVRGVEYVILFAFKIIFAILIVLFMYRIYIDAVRGTLGFRSAMAFFMAILMFITTAFSIPFLLDLSYYQVNKHLLQHDAEYIALLNVEKHNQGKEIGVTSVTTPETTTKLYLKVDDMSIPWYEILDDVLFSSSFKTVSDAYKEEFEGSLLAAIPRFEIKGQNLYVNVNDMFDNVSVLYNPDENLLYTAVSTTPYESYITPYYAILDTLVQRINDYNVKNRVKSYDPIIMNGGAVKTQGMIEPYFTSNEFMINSQDPAGFKLFYTRDTTYTEVNPFTQDELARMSYSKWYQDPDSTKDFDERLDSLGEYTRNFVASNKDLIGKISDDAFLKVMALSIACQHNSEFNQQAGSSIEIYNVDARDIIRLSLASRRLVTTQSSKSFARFVYDNAGVLGVITVAMLIMAYVVGAFIKPVCIGILILCMISSLVIRKVIKREDDKAMEGLIVTMAIMCGLNVAYSFTLKASMLLTSFSLSIPLVALLQVALQMLYLGLMIKVTSLVVSDWKNMGQSNWNMMGMSIIRNATFRGAGGSGIFKVKERENREISNANKTASDIYDEFYTSKYHDSDSKRDRGSK